MAMTQPDSPPSAPEQMPVSGFDIQAPYATSALSPIYVGGDNDAGGRDIVAGSVAEAVANTEARYAELASDTYGLGSHIGDAMNMPGTTSTGSDGGAFYDPPRDY